MAHQGNRTVATDPEAGRAYNEQEISSVNQTTVLPTYRNNGGNPSGNSSTSPAGSSNGEDYDRKDNKEVVDLSTVEPKHEEEYSEKSAFTKKLNQYAHLKRPLIHAALVLFGLGESLLHRMDYSRAHLVSHCKKPSSSALSS